MNNILERLTSDIRSRQALLRADRNIYTHFLKDVNSEELISSSYPYLLKGLEKQGSLVEIIVNIGKRIRQKMKLPEDVVSDAQVGWFVCVSYIECKVLGYRLGPTYKNGKRSKYLSYFLTIKDWKAIKELWSLIDTTKVDLYPLNEQPADWSGPIHKEGITIIKKGHLTALQEFKKDDKQVLFNVLNKLQSVGWTINEDILKVYQHYLRVNTNPNPFKLHAEIDEEKKNSLMIEAEAIEDMALKQVNKTFYHIYNFDFRGRVYVNTAFLHEQSSDNAKGLLMIKEGVPLGDHGFFYLKVHIANCFGNDKIKLEDRAAFVDEHLDLFLSYAEKPKVNQGWIETESPFCFLAGCNELRKIKEWILEGNLVEDYICHLPVYIDGSTNGLQHLVALSKDETIAHLVNLIPQEYPGDLYSYIADAVWKELETMASKLSQEEKDKFWPTINKAKELQAEYENAPDKSEQKALAYAKVQEWRNQNRNIREKIFPLFWLEITNPKDRRKIVKRNVMTLGYGGTAYGFGQQIIEDTRDLSEYLRDKEHLHAAMLGTLVYNTCHKMLPGPAKLLKMFETVAERANINDTYLQWKSPITNFPLVQAYRKPLIVRTKLKYGDEELKIQLQSWTEAVVNKDAQKTGAAPNIIHSFDAAHLCMTVNSADYQMTVVHDSFGTLPGNMGDLFMLVREEFVRFYNSDPLVDLLTQLESQDLRPDRGNLDIKQIVYSDYAFC